MYKKAVVVGAGIAGLAMARALAVRKYKVTVIDRSPVSCGASVRNFGMIWPVGQPDGEGYDTASLSLSIWKQVCTDAGIWHERAGSLHVAHRDDEWQVLEELAGIYGHRHYALLPPGQVADLSPYVNPRELRGGLYSPDEMIVDPRQAIAAIPHWLSEKYGVRFERGKAVTDISYPVLYAGKESWEADEIYICSGADFETLYPEIFAALPVTRCKLQMMRSAAIEKRTGPALCGALSLAHYHSFRAADSLKALVQRFESEMPEYIRYGIHVMISQHENGELTIGDSHEYGLSPDPFDRDDINRLILDYLQTFTSFPGLAIKQTWHGIYPKLTDGSSFFIHKPEEGVTLVNGLGGAGMTLSFGLCENICRETVHPAVNN